MKRVLFALALAAATSVGAQQRDTYNYINGLADRAPDGATGQGVVHTNRTTGRVVAVGAPITRPFPVGQDCSGQYSTPQFVQPSQGPSAGEVIVRGAIGAAIGSRFGGGRGREAMTAIGTGVGVASAYEQPQQNVQPRCVTIFEQQIIGYTFVAQYQHIQVQGLMRRQPQIGEEVEIIVRSVFYAGS
jgi:uncharacterized protein YcfJ